MNDITINIFVYLWIGWLFSWSYANELAKTKQYSYILPMTISIMFLWPISEIIVFIRWLNNKNRIK